MIILMILIFLLFVGGVGGLCFFIIRKADPTRGDASERAASDIAQEMLPFEDIRDGMIVFPHFCYRAVIECSSLNYDLKTEGEREQMEMSFQQFINSLTFPITFFLQTREIDNSKRIQMLKGEIDNTLVEFPNMSGYAEQFLKDMENLSVKIGNSQQKKRYVIVPYEEVADLEELDYGEKGVYAARELLTRCNSVCNGLNAVGVVTRVLDTAELIELIYSSYNRDNFSYAEAIANEDAFAMFVDGDKDRFSSITSVERLENVLLESMNRIVTQNLDADAVGQKVYEQLKELRDKYTGATEEVVGLG